jgi:serine/threonine-protein kinase RsbW
MADEVEITISSHPRWLRLVRQVVCEYALETGFETHDAHAITLAVGEAVGNVIKHSYRGRTDESVVLRCRAEGKAIEISLSDYGEAFDPDLQPMLPPDELRPGGRGLYLMRAIMDEVEFQRDRGLNIVRMRKLLPSPAFKSS